MSPVLLPSISGCEHSAVGFQPCPASWEQTPPGYSLFLHLQSSPARRGGSSGVTRGSLPTGEKTTFTRYSSSPTGLHELLQALLLLLRSLHDPWEWKHFIPLDNQVSQQSPACQAHPTAPAPAAGETPRTRRNQNPSRAEARMDPSHSSSPQTALEIQISASSSCFSPWNVSSQPTPNISGTGHAEASCLH